MMNALSTFAGGCIIAGTAWLATNPLFVDVPFMTVNEISYSQGMISTNRTIHVERTVADWHVTVVGVDRNAPFCQTTRGNEIDQGWSIYGKASSKPSEMPLDVWVGDEGCADRLVAGEYTMIVTWTPRDGTPPVVEMLNFER